jgi:DNA-directed RNA polymerase subunit RPC12/RpoP
MSTSENRKTAVFPADGDPYCMHRSHYVCVTCDKMVCARCGAEMAASSEDWRMGGYSCPSCRERKAKEIP